MASDSELDDFSEFSDFKLPGTVRWAELDKRSYWQMKEEYEDQLLDVIDRCSFLSPRKGSDN
jgi:hypothetical protein